MQVWQIFHDLFGWPLTSIAYWKGSVIEVVVLIEFIIRNFIGLQHGPVSITEFLHPQYFIWSRNISV